MSIPISIIQSVATSVSPASSSLHDHFRRRAIDPDPAEPRILHPLENEGLRLLILENISQEAVAAFRSQGYHVDHHTKAFTEDELVEKIGSYHGIGIRSKTKITARVLQAAKKLLVIGCFCIGTNQVDLEAAAQAGIPVFNSPFSNSRSVAELVMSELVVLSRQLFERAYEIRTGLWNKQSKNCYEIRGKTLGIVGYGHIGSQLSVLAEAFGMRVLFHDVLNIMPLGQAQQVESLDALLAQSDFVTLHVPESPDTINMISRGQLSKMKKGAYLINNARGKVVDIPALIEFLESKHIAGAAIDVFPNEPGANGDPFDDQLNSWASKLRNLPNVVLTPHIGGSTEEAQRMIGIEVSTYVSRYLGTGSTIGAVNFPEVDLRAITKDQQNQIRICHVHRNQPGVLKQVNDALSPYNVEKQYSDSKGEIAYVMADISNVSTTDDWAALKERINNTDANILTRFLA
ncbi:d-3-phosphoglycerate dehydrogenase 2 [Coprinopsis cinerea okayama7|uniref:D-3-phosphoglycerate dehydrogenase 2 n=1 Tax=Coprinopsis cinerea (strain Okayama-7 / 130 / ATCC MYA-4618 / FGSC 9003) TaxID=240176 RepID=A8N1B6_COPC7|nr:d-3-phosphoglycerate dehydrogenase 2 [Coprinopsis cinerea okayama7\|eukprot:XP_001828665.1 d-3-phosphoglycerate dehydrogenase 2 [Coprinopsis cinerea okayama7\